jgi:hypothetical protein|tara:strand:+ start:41 stop:244 length:204 start_codon:yes stop_codon:yes gene_type:complete
MKYIVEIELTQNHGIEIQADSYEDARNKALEQYKQGFISVNSVWVEESAKVVGSTSMPIIEEILGEK